MYAECFEYIEFAPITVTDNGLLIEYFIEF